MLKEFSFYIDYGVQVLYCSAPIDVLVVNLETFDIRVGFVAEKDGYGFCRIDSDPPIW